MNDPKYIDKRSLYTKKREEAGRRYSAQIGLIEDWAESRGWNVPDDKFHERLDKALVQYKDELAEIERKYGPTQNEYRCEFEGEWTAEEILKREG